MAASTTTAPPQVAPHLGEVHQLRSDAPLEPPAQVPRARRLTVVEQARLILWREVSGRWPLYALLGLTVLVAMLAPARWSVEARYLGLGVMLPFAIAQGLGAAVREEGFWAGLGGRAWVREVVPMATTLLALGLTAVLAGGLSRLSWVVWLLAVGLFAVVGFMRGWAATSAGRLLGASILVLLASVSAVTTWVLGIWPILVGVGSRLAVLAGICLVARPLWAHRRPAAAAGRKRGRARWLLVGMAPALVGLVELLWPVPVYGELNLARSLVLPDSPQPLVSGQVVWRVDGEPPVRTGLRGPIVSADLHASGAIFYEARDPEGDLSIGLYTPEGDKLECPIRDLFGDSPSVFSWVAEDGLSMVSVLHDGTLMSVDVARGCGVGTEPSGLPSDLVALQSEKRTFMATDDWRWAEVRIEGRDEVRRFPLVEMPPEAP